MKLSEEELRKLAIVAIEELGDKASPDSVKKVVSSIVDNMETKVKTEPTLNDKTSGRIIITAFGLNKPGIVAAITKALGEQNCDIQDITQKLMDEFFTMIMIVDISSSPNDFKGVQDVLSNIAESLKIKIYCQHEDIFRSMHRI